MSGTAVNSMTSNSLFLVLRNFDSLTYPCQHHSGQCTERVVSLVSGQEEWSVWLLDVTSGQSVQWTERVVIPVSEQMDLSVLLVDRNSEHSGQWIEIVVCLVS